MKSVRGNKSFGIRLQAKPLYFKTHEEESNLSKPRRVPMLHICESYRIFILKNMVNKNIISIDVKLINEMLYTYTDVADANKVLFLFFISSLFIFPLGLPYRK